MFSSILTIIYLIASVTFIVGLKMLSHPETARKGNLIAAGGMALAIFGTIFLYKNAEGNNLGNLVWMFGALVVGGVLGAVSSRRVKIDANARNGKSFQWYGRCMCYADFSYRV
jgi:H+-translocating NAD(P) transhydrogenase subunit beta